ncbi:MAG: aminotransferase class I/II-fold pyridoxal phosphate-dependent enzyme [Dehalococcoidia bacterium]|nr:aminotransferase class I/II-fold pyridoxal phosphate-dependent enzyme [Dehalococcoidia bacterium]
MRPFTDHSPKCIAQVNGLPILVNTLINLCESGIEETVIVVGHLKEKIYDMAGASFNGMRISYIESDCYKTTNNIYSLWLAREHLTEDILLLETDVFFERVLLDRMLLYKNCSVAAVARYHPWMSGTVVSLDEDGNIAELVEGHRQGPDFDYSKVLKTINIYLLHHDFLREQFVPRLEASIGAGDVNQYYETVLYETLNTKQHRMKALTCDDIKWYEVDNENDRLAAEYIFSSPNERYEIVSHEYGSYWRYRFADHLYLYNLYFPPEEILSYIKNNASDLLQNYPSGQDKLTTFMSLLLDQPAQRIVVGNGASEIIKIISGRLFNKLIVPVPSFNEYVNASPEGKAVSFALKAPSFELDIDEFASEALHCKADVAVVLSPNNPTSLLVSKPDLLHLAEKLAGQNCLLIVDESFIDFAANREQATLEYEIAEHENLAIIKSMSKAYGICGLRLGYLLSANQKLVTAVKKELPIWNVNGFAEAFLRQLPQYRQEFKESCRKVRNDRDNLYQRLSSIPGMIVYKPEANFVFCRLPDEAMSGPEITHRLFTKYNKYIKPCTGKMFPESDRYLRIASRTTPENDSLVDALVSILTEKTSTV